MGLMIERARGHRKKVWLAFSVAANVGVLGVFKYFNFFDDTVTSVLAMFGMPPSINHVSLILPLGLSFHTFQSLSYIFEVYYGRYKAETHFGYYALYVMFFPQLVAGPIERPGNLLPQLREPAAFDAERVIEGGRLMLWGLFKK